MACVGAAGSPGGGPVALRERCRPRRRYARVPHLFRRWGLDDTTRFDVGVCVIVSPTSKRGGPPGRTSTAGTGAGRYALNTCRAP